jgi:hypothetical protein
VRAGTSSGCGACVWVLVSVTAKTIMSLVRRLALLGSAVLCPGYADPQRLVVRPVSAACRPSP